MVKHVISRGYPRETELDPERTVTAAIKHRPPVRDRPDDRGSFRKQVLLVALPAFLALAGTVWLVEGPLRRASHDEAAKLNARILDQTSKVVRTLRKARKLLVTQGYKQAAEAKRLFAVERDLWMDERVALRAQVRSIYGDGTANLLADRAGRNLVLDRCYVLVERGDPSRGTRCGSRLKNEVDVLTARQDALNEDKSYDLARSGVVVPGDFTTNLTFANNLLERVADCKAPAGPEQSAQAILRRCPNLQDLQHALNLRVNVLGTVQEALEDQLVQQ